MNLPVAVDALGGDKAPDEILQGVLDAVAAGIPCAVVGPENLQSLTKVDISGLPLIPASEVIAMDEDPAGGVRRKKDSTLVRAAEAVRDGKASAMISAGNTGATMASALLRMGRVKGVNRPAIATPIPVPGHTPTVLLDAGANAEVQADWLVQFGVMGSIYATRRFGIDKPRVGLLSIGEEPGKGDTLRKEAYELLAAASGINFIGNVEGRDIMTPDVDVVVTDGFTGNVVLKTLEGSLKTVVKALFGAFGAPELKIHADALLPALLPLYESLDPDTYGGAILLGVDGVCIISHGSSSARAMLNGIKVAKEMVDCRMVEEIRTAIGLLSEASGQ
ncbi:MAG: fatty acid/phospholipid synthesis protein PlsX [Actinomycetota bacterium]